MSKRNTTNQVTRSFSLDVNDGLIAAFSSVLSMCIVFFNSIVFVSLRKKVSGFLLFKGLLHLTVVDGLTGLIVHPFYSAQMILGILEDRLEHNYFIAFQRFAGYTLQCLGVLTVIFIAVQSYCSIARPFCYTSSLNKKYSRKSLLIGWLLAAMVTALFSILLPRYWSVYQSFLFLCVAIAFVVNLILYSMILWQVKQLDKVHPFAYVQRKWGNNIKICVWILITFFMSYSPLIILTTYKTSGGNISYNIYRHLQPWLILLSISSSFFNPLVYCFRLRDVRKNLLKIASSIVAICIRRGSVQNQNKKSDPVVSS